MPVLPHDGDLFRAFGLRGCVLLCIVATSGCTTVRRHEDCEERIQSIRSAAVMPIDFETRRFVSFVSLKVSSQDVQTALSEVRAALVGGLKDHGIEALTWDRVCHKAEVEPELQAALTELDRRWAEVDSDLYRSRRAWKGPAGRCRASLGEPAVRLSRGLNVDALVLVDLRVYRQGILLEMPQAIPLLALFAMGGGYPGEEIVNCTFALVDGDTGDVLWANHAKRDRTWKSPLVDFIPKVLRDMPAGGSDPLLPTVPADP